MSLTTVQLSKNELHLGGNRKKWTHSTPAQKRAAILYIKSMCQSNRPISEGIIRERFNVSRLPAKLLEIGVLAKEAGSYRGHYKWVSEESVDSIMLVVFSRGVLGGDKPTHAEPNDNGHPKTEAPVQLPQQQGVVTASALPDNLENLVKEAIDKISKYAIPLDKAPAFIADHLREYFQQKNH